MQFGVHYPSSTDFRDILDDVEGYDALGLDTVWLGESYGYDAATALGALAARTERIKLAFGVIPVQTRTAALIAMTAAGLDAISGGRAVLGIGTSGAQVIEGFHDAPFGPPLRRQRLVIDTCRAVWRGQGIVSERTTASGADYRALKAIHRPAAADIPIFVGAIGQRNVELTAACADGWITAFLWPERMWQVWGGALEKGTAGRAQTLGPLQVTATVPLAIDADLDVALASHRARLAHYIGGMGTAEDNFYTRLAGTYGFGDVAEQMRALYLAGQRQAATDLLPEELVCQTCLIGDRATVDQRIAAYASAGVTMINVVPVGETQDARLDQVRRLLA